MPSTPLTRQEQRPVPAERHVGPILQRNMPILIRVYYSIQLQIRYDTIQDAILKCDQKLT